MTDYFFMKRTIIVLLFQFATTIAFSQSENTVLSIIPEPVSVVKNNGNFILRNNIVIETNGNREANSIASLLSQQLSASTGYTASIAGKTNPSSTIRFVLNKNADQTIGNEGYTLSVTSNNIIINANEPAGLFYGVQTLLQLFPKEIESKNLVKNIKWQTPCVSITDYPRFGWRGLMFDVARHFFTKQQVKDFIDEMVKYKYNILHLHLTDDEGWRIEIKSLPKLTQWERGMLSALVISGLSLSQNPMIHATTADFTRKTILKSLFNMRKKNT